MSYLEMPTGIDNMSSAIISVWFRDARKNAPPPAEPPWPSGVWSQGTDSMVPPDVLKVVQTDEYKHSVFYWNAYGRYIKSIEGLTLPILGPASVMTPTPPPFVIDQMHTMLTFGNPSQNYDYCPWQVQFPDVIEAVNYVPMIITGPQWSVPGQPPPYAPWIVSEGKFKVATFVLSGPTSKPNLVPQSFIGVDKDGYLTICLQTDTKAKYKGYAFQLDKVTPIWATVSYFAAPFVPLGHGDPGHWVKVPGYWDGYEFRYTDISDKVMGAQPETFVIGGPPGNFDFATIPRVSDGSWHHLLFSFDISGSVRLSLPSTTGGAAPSPIVSTQCKAWLVLDGKNYTGAELQHRFPVHDGLQLPLLPGVGSDVIGFGPVTSATAAEMKLSGNDILPRNCWIVPMKGNPKDGLLRFSSTAGTWNQPSTRYINQGDYNWFAWTGNVWPLYGDNSGSDWRGALDPPQPSTPDPATFDVPTYEGGPFNIPVAGFSIGIPASTHHLDHNTGIEMGELQVWANIAQPADDIKNLFIDENGKPVPPKEAKKVLGTPDILLHGSSNWKSGNNTGSGSDFQPRAKIRSYVPNPQLGK